MKSKEDQLKNWQRIQIESQRKYAEKNRTIIKRNKFNGSNERTPKGSVGKKHRRTTETDIAIQAAKERDGFKCLVCWRSKALGYIVNGCHICPRRIGFPRVNKADKDQIWTGCTFCHGDYDKQNTIEKKIIWMLSRPKLYRFAVTLYWITDMSISSPDEIKIEYLKDKFFYQKG